MPAPGPVAPQRLFVTTSRSFVKDEGIRQKLKDRENDLQQLRTETDQKLQNVKDLAEKDKAAARNKILSDATDKAKLLRQSWDLEKEDLRQQLIRAGQDKERAVDDARQEVRNDRDRQIEYLKQWADKSAQAQLDAKGAQMKGLEKQIQDLKDKVQAGITGAAQAATVKQAELDTLQKDMDFMLKEAEQTLTGQEAILSEQLRAATELAQAKLEAAKQEISGLRTKVGEQRVQLAGVSAAHQALQDRFNEAHVALAAANAKIATLDDTSRDYSKQVQAQVAKRNKAYAALDVVKKQMEAVRMSQAGQAQSMSGLQEQLRTAQSETAKAQQALLTEQVKAKELRDPAALDKAHGNLQRAQEQVASLSKELGLASGELKGVKSELAYTQAELARERALKAEADRNLAAVQRDYQEARGRETVAESNLQAEMTNQATLSKQGAKVDESALNALRAAHDKVSGGVSNLRDKLQEISKQLGISEEPVISKGSSNSLRGS